MTSSLPRRPEPSQKRYCQVPPLYPAAPPHWWRGPFPLVSCLSPSTGLHPLRVLGLRNWSEMEAYLLWVLLLPFISAICLTEVGILLLLLLLFLSWTLRTLCCAQGKGNNLYSPQAREKPPVLGSKNFCRLCRDFTQL